MPRKADLLLILALLLLSLLPLALWPGQEADAVYAEITVDGVLRHRVALSGHHGTEEFSVETPAGRNIIRVEEDRISIIDADCPDKLCMRVGSIQRPGETVACLPHKLLIEVKGRADKEDEDVLPAR